MKFIKIWSKVKTFYMIPHEFDLESQIPTWSKFLNSNSIPALDLDNLIGDPNSLDSQQNLDFDQI
jgi:hypothetical protein